MYLTLAKLFLTLASAVIQYMNNQQLLEAGAAQATLKGIQDATDAISVAKSARATGANRVPVTDDPFNRDNKR